MSGCSALAWSPEMLMEGQPVRVDDGNDTAEGSTTDAAIFSDSSGTVIGFLRGLLNLTVEQRRLIEALVVRAQEPLGAVDQGAPGTQPWPVDGSKFTQPVAVQGSVAVSALPAVTGTVTAIAASATGLLT